MATWDWQQAIALAIVASAAWFLVRRFYLAFAPRPGEAGASPGCCGCTVGKQCSVQVAAVSNCHSHLGALIELGPPSGPRQMTRTGV